MRACPQCGTLNPPGSERCSTCNASLAPPALRPEPSRPSAGSAEPAPPGSSAPREPAAEPPRPNRPSGPTSGRPSSGAQAATRAIPLPASSISAPDAAASAADADVDLDPDHLDVLTAHGDAKRIVTVIGFGASGKTFLVNRLRHALPLGRRWKTYPRKQERIEITPEGLWLTEVNPARRGAGKPYVLVDCAGESFQRAFDEQSTEARLSGIGVRSYLTALACASAYVFVIPAETLVEAAAGGAAERAKVAHLGEEFHQIIDGIRLAKHDLGKHGAKAFLARGIDRRAFKVARSAPGPQLAEPLFVALSQADRIEAVEPLDDPYLFARDGALTLATAIENRFLRYRFDFVSSFVGHDPPPHDPNLVDYTRPHHGAVEMFEWIDRQLSTARGGISAALAGELPTRYPLWLRRLADPEIGGGR